MKKHWIGISVLLAGIAGCPVFAADTSATPPASGSQGAPAVWPKRTGTVESAWERRIDRFDCEGQPLVEIVRELRAKGAFPEVNFVVPESARQAEVGEITLRSVTLGDILKALELTSEGRITYQLHGGKQGSDPSTGMPYAGQVDPLTGTPLPALGTATMVSFAYNPAATPPNSEPNPVLCRVFSLKGYLAGAQSESMVNDELASLERAIAMALDMLKKADPEVERPEFSIHAETRLFIAVGRAKELDVVQQVVNELQVGKRSLPLPTVPAQQR